MVLSYIETPSSTCLKVPKVSGSLLHTGVQAPWDPVRTSRQLCEPMVPADALPPEHLEVGLRQLRA